MSNLLERLNSALSDRYTIESEVGRGGMATVFLARDLKHDREVALKVLHPEIAATLGSERFLREIQITARLEHPNILTLIDSGKADGLPYFVMPYLEGGSLRERLDTEGELPIEKALQIAAEVADGLDYAHEIGVVHRDIKPSNILLYRGHALIADFGVARALDVAGGSATVTGLAVGTPKYMSPEQAAGKTEIDGRSDVYGPGCVLWEMLAGESPYDGPTPHAILARKVSEDTPSLRIRRKTVTRELENVLAKAMARSPADRFATAGEFAKALKSGGAGVRRPSRLTPVLRKRLTVGAMAAAALALAAVAWWQTRPAPPGQAAVSETGIAFLPFEEQGDISGRLEGDSIAGALSLLFSATERYEPETQGHVRQAIADKCSGIESKICGFQVASELGTAFFVTGKVTPMRGDSVHLLAEMFDVTGEQAFPPVTVSGDRDDPNALLFALVRELWLVPISESEQGVLLTSGTTQSLDAFAAFLDGEIYFDAWQLPEAQKEFEKAVAADSTLAMAWYRLAIIWDWRNYPSRLKAVIDMALAHADRLPDRERRALNAFDELVWGASETAEQVFLELLEEEPDDPLVNYQLGLLSFGYAWKQARPMTQAIESFRRVLAVQPENSSAAIYLMWALAQTGDYEAMEELDSQFPDNENFWVGIRLIRGHRLGDSALVRTALDSLSARPLDLGNVALGLYVLGTTHGAVPDLELAADDFRLWADSAYLAVLFGRLDGYVNLRVASGNDYAAVEFGRGRLRSSRAAFERVDSLPPSIAPPNMAMLASLPLPGGNPSDTTYLAERVRSWTLPELSQLREWETPEVFILGVSNTHRQFEHLIRPYVLGLLASAAGDFTAAMSYADEVESLDPVQWYPSGPHDFAQGVRADVLLRQGRPREAIEALDAARQHLNYNEVFLAPIIGAGRAGYLRALALQQLGMHEEALRWYEYGRHGLAGFFNVTLLAATHLHRGEIYEAMGDTAQAIWHYDAFAELWKDADPELQVKVREVLQHVAELRGEVVDVTAGG